MSSHVLETILVAHHYVEGFCERLEQANIEGLGVRLDLPMVCGHRLPGYQSRRSTQGHFSGVTPIEN